MFWETEFKKQFEEILHANGIDPSDEAAANHFRSQLDIKKGPGCVLMIEVEENWKEQLTQLLQTGLVRQND
ncbi:MAG: hypothetical protein ONB16_07290 [candidate division KSB1 bacterium]|nr:hypothetical protein [candidate division KSB1 bacterium]